MVQNPSRRLRIAAIRFLNPAPLMWDFDHSPLREELASRYDIEWMLPSECADQLVSGASDIGLVPVATLAQNPELRVLPGCTIASKARVRSLLLVRRARQPLESIRTVAADTASRTTVAHARILFHAWENPGARFMPMAADLDSMLEQCDAAVVIGDPALMALEESANRLERTEEELTYHDLAWEWRKLTGLPFVSAVWAAGPHVDVTTRLAEDFVRSRDHGLTHIDELVAEWSARLPLSEDTIQTYLRANIHYVLDDECVAGMRRFFTMAAELAILPAYELSLAEQAA